MLSAFEDWSVAEKKRRSRAAYILVCLMAVAESVRSGFMERLASIGQMRDASGRNEMHNILVEVKEVSFQALSRSRLLAVPVSAAMLVGVFAAGGYAGYEINGSGHSSVKHVVLGQATETSSSLHRRYEFAVVLATLHKQVHEAEVALAGLHQKSGGAEQAAIRQQMAELEATIANRDTEIALVQEQRNRLSPSH